VLADIKNYDGKGIVVRGLPNRKDTVSSVGQVEVYNHLPAKELEVAFKRSKVVISRSGYTTVMDILKLRKKSILIPTPGQTEQEYLASSLQQKGYALHVSQQFFQLSECLDQAETFNFLLPQIDMEMYKQALDNFLIALQKA
jgi:UDP-N-acetylglucosamine:LPS N-acetylglucosamine transferase